MEHFPAFPPAANPHAIGQRLLQRAHNLDGLPEIAMGSFFLLSAGLIYAQVALPKGSAGYQAVVLAVAFLMPALVISFYWGLKRVRRRYLTAQWGYVEHRVVDPKRLGLGLAVAGALALVHSGVTAYLPYPERWLMAGAGLAGGALLVWGGRQPRFVMQGALMASMGVLVALSGVSTEIGFAILFGLQGLAALTSGCVVFRRFLRQAAESERVA